MRHATGIALAALAIACAALALTIRGTVRGPDHAKVAAAGGGIDRETRDELERLRRAVTVLEARVARTAAAAAVPGAASGSAEPATPPAAPVDPGPILYARFEIPNPAVTITQKDDGLLDIRTTDPTLAGSIIVVTGITEAGDEEKLHVRIPD